MAPTTTDVASREDALALHEALTDLVRAYQFRDRDTICCYDVSLGQSQGLERLLRSGPMTVKEFAAALFLEKSSASRVVDGLEKKGYVTRRAGEDDARFVRIELTKRGRVLARRIEDDLVAKRREALGELTSSERQAVVRAMEHLARAAAAPIEGR